MLHFLFSQLLFFLLFKGRETKSFYSYFISQIHIRFVRAYLTEICLQFGNKFNRTPDLCAMQQDNSGDLQAVGSLLYDKAGVSFL